MFFMFGLALATFAATSPQQLPGTLIVETRSGSEVVSQAEILVGDQVVLTDQRGQAQIELPAGNVTITVQRFGFTRQTLQAQITAGVTSRITVELQSEVVLEQEVTVTATRTEHRIDDVPIRVEVLQQEEIEEKALMTPGDIAMLLNETSGLRVQVTSPSLGAANVRIQGLRGRYTQLLADGLPLYGGQTGTIGLLQIPPLDLGQVEIIKGVASALYGSSALGGVINLMSRRPEQAEGELLLNQTSRNGTDGVLWLADSLKSNWSYTLLAGLHHQQRQDIDNDGWSDMAGYLRGIVRPRLYWDDGSGSSIFITAGAMLEDRTGGTIDDATLDGNPFPEELRTDRYDAGIVGRFLAGRQIVTVRGSAMTQEHGHVFGPDIERDRHHTIFGEFAVTGSAGRHTWAAGSALQADLYRSRDVPRFDYTYVVPAIFFQDDFAITPRFTLSGSGRFDFHSDYGTFFNPRVSALFRLPRSVTARVSAGTGVFAPTPFTEETEAVGLRNVRPLTGVATERAWSASADLGWKVSNIELNGTVFRSVVRDPIALLLPEIQGELMEIVNSDGPIQTVGSELLARFRKSDFSVTMTHTFIHSSEVDPNDRARDTVPLTPRHTAGFVGMWEKENKGRVGIEVFYTGIQRLEHNPYRTESEPYWILGILAERHFGRFRLFINGENLTNTRQTRYDPLVRPQRHVDGRWTVDAWAPLEGRTINGGIRLAF
jgi:iron complex outermembrane receptor protein